MTSSSSRASSPTCGGGPSASTSPASPTSWAPAMVVTLGALLTDIPHTRPTSVIGTADSAELITRLDLRPSAYEGPTGIVGALHQSCRTAGLDSISLWGSVPVLRPGQHLAQGRPRPARAHRPAPRLDRPGHRPGDRHDRLRAPARRAGPGGRGVVHLRGRAGAGLRRAGPARRRQRAWSTRSSASCATDERGDRDGPGEKGRFWAEHAEWFTRLLGRVRRGARRRPPPCSRVSGCSTWAVAAAT